MNRVLVTGASGFIGRWSIPALLGRGYDVHAVVAHPRAPGLIMPQLAGAQLHVANLLDRSSVDDLVARVQPTHLLHLAWNVTPPSYWTSAENFRWVAATLHLVSAFRAAGGARATVAGTCAEYDWARADVCVEDKTPLASDGNAVPTPYATCKIASQKMIAAFSRQEGLSAAWGRIFFQYGPDEHPDRLVASVIRNLLAGREALCTHGRQVRNFLHVADVAEALVAVLDSTVEGPVNIGSRERTSIAELVQSIAAQVGRRELVRLGARPAAPNEPEVLVPDVERLYTQVRWHPRLSLAAGLADTIDWWRHRQ